MLIILYNNSVCFIIVMYFAVFYVKGIYHVIYIDLNYISIY